MNPSWQILPSRLTRDLTSFTQQPSPVSADTGRSVKTGYSGRGILRPFRRANTGDFEIGEGEKLVRAAVGLVLGTCCQSLETQGELPWRTEFGSLLRLLRLQNNDATLHGLAQQYVVEAIKRWVPSVRVTDASIHQGPRPESLIIVITYDIVDPPSARVIVSGIQTAAQLG